jgi:hypothetical protein
MRAAIGEHALSAMCWFIGGYVPCNVIRFWLFRLSLRKKAHFICDDDIIIGFRALQILKQAVRGKLRKLSPNVSSACLQIRLWNCCLSENFVKFVSVE